MRAALAACLLVGATVLSGCSGLGDLWDSATRPSLSVQRTDWRSGEWSREAEFQVVVQEPGLHSVRIEAAPQGGGTPLAANGTSGGPDPSAVTLRIPDGTWDLTYWIDGHRWERMRGVRLDTQPPAIVGLETVLDAPQGAASIGEGARVEEGAQVEVRRQSTGAILGHSLPLPVSGLPDGVHGYDVAATDAAGNVALATVQVRVGDALRLPDGQHTFGVVARYRQDVVLWDISDPGAYATRAAARAAAMQLAPEGYLGAGFGITPADAQVKAAADAAVDDDDNALEAALALFRWMAGELEYDEARLEEEGLLQPRETMQAGGGVCRDLAALYVSLLRAAGVPARLVAGYLAGEVNGFHAWVEAYVGGPGPSPWLPVDVSPIDGPASPEQVVGAFGIHQPGHLAMRALTEPMEDQPWSDAMRVDSTYRSGSPEPNVRLAKDLEVSFEARRTLCVDLDTLERRVVADASQCASASVSRFLASAEMVLDYGVVVVSASDGTTLEARLAYPVGPAAEAAEWTTYGVSFAPDAGAGVLVGTWER